MLERYEGIIDIITIGLFEVLIMGIFILGLTMFFGMMILGRDLIGGALVIATIACAVKVFIEIVKDIINNIKKELA